MQANQRQISILYEFLQHRENLSYSYLCHQFNVCEKTVREDIRVINDCFVNFQIKICLKKNKGFYLYYKERKMLEELRCQFEYRFGGSKEIQSNSTGRTNELLALLLTARNYIHLHELSLALSLNNRTVSLCLKEVRVILESYQLKLEVKPHYGMKIVGDEILIRFCYMDTICFYANLDSGIDLFDDGLGMFQLSETDKLAMTEICFNFVKQQKIPMNQNELRKFIILLLVQQFRIKSNKFILYSLDRYDFLESLVLKFDIKTLVQSIENYYHNTLSIEEIDFLIMFIFCIQDYGHLEHQSNLPEQIILECEQYWKSIASRLEALGICRKQTLPLFKKSFFPIFIQSCMKVHFRIIEHDANSYLKKAMMNSPLSLQVGLICFQQLQKASGWPLGETIEINLCLAVYSTIRATVNIKKLNTLAVFTPADKASGESLKKRIVDRFSNIIKKIDVLTLNDLMQADMSQYNFLLRFEKIPPIGLPKTVHQLEVDYFFTEEDVITFYEVIAVPSRIYRNPFATVKKSDYIMNFHFTDLNSFKNTLMTYTEDTVVFEQIQNYQMKSKSIFNGTLSIIFFSNVRSALFSKLILLHAPVMFKHQHFSRIFVHTIKVNGDMIKLKTGEKVIRNLISNEDTMKEILELPFLKFYEFYVQLDIDSLQ